MTENSFNNHAARALIVDDSAVARKVLASILHREGLETDVAASAEDALAYLERTTPDVIFLDHNMPGMNGFEALKAIKSNPRTARIPVMMFTSQSGEAYFSQARALGAVDVLGKDALADIDLSERLQQLGIFERAPDQARTATDGVARHAVTADDRQLARLIRLLLKEEFGKLRQELPALVEEAAGRASGSPDADALASSGSARSRGAWKPWAAAAASAALVWTLMAHPWRTNEARIDEDQPVAVAAVNLKRQTPPKPAALDDQEKRLLPVISWAVNRQMNYGPGEQPLAGERLDRIRTVLSLLANAGFKGKVEVAVHQGRFCTTTDAAGNPVLPSGDAPISACEIQPAGKSGIQAMSLPFAMFMENSPLANGERGIRLSVINDADDEPLMLYPDPGAGVTAEDWNHVALANNRVELRLQAE